MTSAARVVPAALALALAAAPAAGQKLIDKDKPPNDPVNCIYTGGDPELLGRIGVLDLGGFDFATESSTAAVDAFLATSDIRWVETDHFKIGMALSPYKIPMDEKDKLRAELEVLEAAWPDSGLVAKKVRVLDPWLRVYLFAVRAEALWDEMLAFLGVEESEFPDGSKPWNTKGEYMGIGPYLGEKGKFEVLFLPSEAASESYLRHYFGLRTKKSQRWNIVEKDTLHLVMHAGQGKLKNDEAMHAHFVFNMTIQMLNAYKHYSYEIPPWIKEGVAHWMERRVSQRYNTFDASEGAVAEMTSKVDWEPPTFQMVSKGDAISMATLINMRGFAEMELEHHFTTWSMVDYLTREHPDFLPTLLRRIKGMTNEQFIDDGTGLDDVHREAFRELLGMSYGQFTRAWQEWVLANYRSK